MGTTYAQKVNLQGINRFGNCCSNRLTAGFWRARASSSTTTIFFGGACAIVTVRERFVKSFLRVWPKLFLSALVCAPIIQ